MITVVSQQLLTSEEKRIFAQKFNSKLTYPVDFNYCTLDQFTGESMTVLFGFNTEETRDFCKKYPDLNVITLATSNSLGGSFNRVLYSSIGCNLGDILECLITNEQIIDDYKKYLVRWELNEAPEVGANDVLNEFETNIVQIKNNRSENDTLILGVDALYEKAKSRQQEVFLTTQLKYDADQDTPNVFMTGGLDPALVDFVYAPCSDTSNSFYNIISKSTGKVLGLTSATVLASNGYVFKSTNMPVYNLAASMGKYTGNTYVSFFDTAF
jgi:hypothetical protein